MKSIIILTILGVVLMYLGLLKNKKYLFPVAIGGLLIALIASLFDWNTNAVLFNNMMTVDNYSITFNVSMIFTTILILMLANSYFTGPVFNLPEIYVLIVFSLAGALMMTSFSNIIMLFIGIETMSIPLYVLAGSKKFSIKSNEASFKYFILGSFSTAIFLLGVTLIYGATGSFFIQGIADFVTKSAGNIPTMFYGGMLLILISMSFKVAAAPFHFWAPDVYDGSPTLTTLFMATVIKTAGFAAFLRLFSGCFASLGGHWQITLMVMIFLTLIIGNVGALRQPDTKRMLAYSSISHTGFLLLAILAINSLSASAILYYTIAYSLSTVSAFAVYMLVKNNHVGIGAIDSFNGLGKAHPFLSIVMTISMLSFAGIPVTAGFFAKYYVFVAAMKSQFIGIVIVAILAALVGIYYYFKIIIAMYFKEGEAIAIKYDWTFRTSLIVATCLTLIIGIFPSLILQILK